MRFRTGRRYVTSGEGKRGPARVIIPGEEERDGRRTA